MHLSIDKIFYLAIIIIHAQGSILCEKPGLGLSSDSVAMLSYLKETNMAAVYVHNPLPVQRSSYITVQLPNGLCTLVRLTTWSLVIVIAIVSK